MNLNHAILAAFLCAQTILVNTAAADFWYNSIRDITIYPGYSRKEVIYQEKKLTNEAVKHVVDQISSYENDFNSDDDLTPDDLQWTYVRCSSLDSAKYWDWVETINPFSKHIEYGTRNSIDDILTQLNFWVAFKPFSAWVRGYRINNIEGKDLFLTSTENIHDLQEFCVDEVDNSYKAQPSMKTKDAGNFFISVNSYRNFGPIRWSKLF